MKASLEHKGLAGFGLGLLVLGLIGTLSYQRTLHLIGTGPSEEVLIVLEDTFTTVLDAETGQRGYLITGEERYLDPYNTATAHVDTDLQRLRELAADDTAQQTQLAILHTQVHDKLRELQETIDLRRRVGFAAAHQVVLTDRGRAAMIAIRKIITALEHDALDTLQRRETGSTASAWQTIQAFGALVPLVVALLGTLPTLIRRELTERKQAEEVLWASEERYRRLVELSPEAMLVHSGGRIVYINPAAIRITERKRAEEARWAHETAEAANQAKSEFLSRMSHELRTPLHAILGFAQLLEMEDLSVSQRDALNSILRAGRHLLDLINEVLDIARIEARRLALSPEPIPVGTLLRESLELVGPLAAVRRIHLTLDLPPEHDWHVMADYQRLKQVLLNLLSNAIKYNNEGGQVILAGRSVEAGGLRISVRDTGPGISSEQMARLFRPFERLSAEGSGIEGTGLGLALSQHLVEAMGGRLAVDSVVGAGSTFWLELPCGESPVADLASEHALPSRTAPPPFEVAYKVLYIEDNLSNLRLLERLFAGRSDIKLLAAMQGRLGLELAHEHYPDLILLDLHLPDMRGDEVLRQLQANPALRSTAVIMISADATPGQAARLRTAGARAYLTKPLQVSEFLAVVDASLPKGVTP
jgi:signal transduction histidine kinase/CheY-like chemotaxis protein